MRPRPAIQPPPAEVKADDPNYKDINQLAELPELRERYWGKSDFSGLDSSLFQPFLAYLRNYSNESASNLRFSEAKTSSLMAERLKAYIKYQSEPKPAPADESELNHLKEDTEAAQNSRIQKAEKEFADRKTEILKRHSEQLNEFEEKWKLRKPIQYRKVSSEMLSLIQMEKTLTITSEFEKAETINKEIGSLTTSEASDAQRRIGIDYISAKDHILNKQKEELEKLETERQCELSLIRTRNAIEECGIANRENVVKQKEKTIAYKWDPIRRSGVVFYSGQGKKYPAQSLILPIKAPNDPEIPEKLRKRPQTAQSIRPESQKSTDRAMKMAVLPRLGKLAEQRDVEPSENINKSGSVKQKSNQSKRRSGATTMSGKAEDIRFGAEDNPETGKTTAKLSLEPNNKTEADKDTTKEKENEQEKMSKSATSEHKTESASSAAVIKDSMETTLADMKIIETHKEEKHTEELQKDSHQKPAEIQASEQKVDHKEAEKIIEDPTPHHESDPKPENNKSLECNKGSSEPQKSNETAKAGVESENGKTNQDNIKPPKTENAAAQEEHHEEIHKVNSVAGTVEDGKKVPDTDTQKANKEINIGANNQIEENSKKEEKQSEGQINGIGPESEAKRSEAKPDELKKAEEPQTSPPPIAAELPKAEDQPPHSEIKPADLKPENAEVKTAEEKKPETKPEIQAEIKPAPEIAVEPQTSSPAKAKEGETPIKTDVAFAAAVEIIAKTKLA